MDGRALRFRLSGINNQNFLMRDEETGSWWQQVSGEAILGPLKGKKLRQVPHDELSFALFQGERPAGRVLREDQAAATAGKYDGYREWEPRVGKLPVTTSAPLDPALPPRTLIAGICAGGACRAYPVATVTSSSPLVDAVGEVPIVLLAGSDGRSLRAFERRVDGREIELFASTDRSVVDAATGSTWDFGGRAIAGPLAGRTLTPIPLLEDYWFDWKTYHPESSRYSR